MAAVVQCEHGQVEGDSCRVWETVPVTAVAQQKREWEGGLLCGSANGCSSTTQEQLVEGWLLIGEDGEGWAKGRCTL